MPKWITISVIARIVGVCRLPLGSTAIIAWTAINKGTEARTIIIPTPKVADAIKPMRSLALADANADGSCVISSKLNEENNNIVKVDIGTVASVKSCNKTKRVG